VEGGRGGNAIFIGNGGDGGAGGAGGAGTPPGTAGKSGSGGTAGLFAPSPLAAFGPYQNLVTNTAANLQSIGNAWLADPSPFLRQMLTNQLGITQLAVSSLAGVTRDFAIGLAGIPPSLRAAFEALLAGDISGAVGDVAGGLIGLLVSGVDATDASNILLRGTVGDLLPLLSIPGHVAHNVANTITTLTDTRISVDVTTLSVNLGLPLALTVDAL